MNVIGRAVMGLVAGFFVGVIFVNVSVTILFFVDIVLASAGVIDDLFLCEFVMNKSFFLWTMRAGMLLGVITSLVSKEGP